MNLLFANSRTEGLLKRNDVLEPDGNRWTISTLSDTEWAGPSLASP